MPEGENILLDSDIFLLKFAILIFLFILSAVLSGAETGYFSFTETDLKKLKKKATKKSLRVIKFLRKPKLFFITIKFSYLIINISTIIVGLLLTQDFVKLFGISLEITLFITIVIITFVLFIISELWVKLLVLRHYQTFAEFISFPLNILYSSMIPLASIIAKFISVFTPEHEVTRKSTLFNQQKIMSLVEESQERGALDDTGRDMIHSIFELGETEVHEIMVPRIDMVCAEENIKLEDLTKLIKEKGHTRIPLYSQWVDNILGIIHAKDLLPYLINGDYEKVKLKTLVRPAYFVPESKKLHQLLKEFQQKKSHMAIVVDEYGGTAGLVTLEDIIEEIVGDIQDEYDQELPLYRKLDENTFLVDAKIDLHELNEKLEIDLPTEGGYESLGGFILTLTGYVPDEKEVVKYNGYTFVVEKIDRNRIVRVKLSKITPQEDSSKENEEVP